VTFDYLLLEEYANCWIYLISLLMEDGRWCSGKHGLESVSPRGNLDLPSLIEGALYKRGEQMRRKLEWDQWSVVGDEDNGRHEIEWDHCRGYEII
jgi:hypothetical protein